MEKNMKNKALLLASLFAFGMTMQPLFGMQTTQQELDEELCHAIELNDLDYTKKSLERGANINYVDSFTKMTPLHCAKTSQMTQYLIEKGAHVDSKDGAGFTPLHYAVINNNFPSTYCLINNNANINSMSISNGTPLHQATQGNLMEMVENLIEQGADITLNDSSQQTPYQLALSMKHNYIAIYLGNTEYYNQQKHLLNQNNPQIIQRKVLNKLKQNQFTDVLLICQKK